MGSFIFMFNLNFVKFIFKRLLASKNNSPDTVFTTVFMTFWVGSIIISINGKLLGGQM
jgi:hypothetical protein